MRWEDHLFNYERGYLRIKNFEVEDHGEQCHSVMRIF